MTTRTETRIEAVHARLPKARAIVDLELVEKLSDGSYIVHSQRMNGDFYSVDQTGCNCPDVQYAGDTTGGFCKHKLATKIWEERNAIK